MIGETISHYRILEKLGEGGMGVVYRAEDTTLKRQVALKFLPPELTSDRKAKERFIREAQAASKLDHANICIIHEVSEHEDGQMFIAMAYYRGETLRNKIELGPLKQEAAVDIATQILQGLARASEAGIIHRDIKPANIIVTNRGEVKIVDFGLAKLADQPLFTSVGSSFRSVEYMSPEQARGEEIDQRCDLFSFGLVLYEMLTGCHPFRSEYEQSVLYAIINNEPEPVTSFRPALPIEFARIVNKCLEKDLAVRYQSAEEVAADLLDLKRSLTDSSSTSRSAEKAKPSSRWTWLAGMAVGAALVIGISFRFLSPDKTNPISVEAKLAVLPFENLGPKEEDYFADGLTEEVTARLANIKGIGVAASSNSIKYRNTNKTIQQIGEELSIDYLLKGTVDWQRLSERATLVRVTPELIRVKDATNVWSQVYQNDLEDIFTIQSDIVKRVATALDISLPELEQASAETIKTQNLQAYDYWLRANDYLMRGKLQLAKQTSEKAIELDSNFAHPYIIISYVHLGMYTSFHDRTEERLAKAKKAVDMALQLEPDLPSAHLTLGSYYYRGRADYKKALKEFQFVKKNHPDNTIALQKIASVYRPQGRIGMAIETLKQALRLNPNKANVYNSLAWNHRLLRDYPQAIHYFDEALSRRPENFGMYPCKALVHISWKGDKQTAWEVLKDGMVHKPSDWALPNVSDHKPWWIIRILQDDHESLNDWHTLKFFGPDTMSYYLSKAELHGRKGKLNLSHSFYDTARVILEKKIKMWPDEARYHSQLGIAYAGLGRKGEAIREGKLAEQMLPVSKNAVWGRAFAENLAWTYMLVGDYDAAIEQLEFLLSVPGILSAPFLGVDPLWEPLRDHPRFAQLLEKEN
ncbi:MAG: protein kinase [bacterium]